MTGGFWTIRDLVIIVSKNQPGLGLGFAAKPAGITHEVPTSQEPRDAQFLRLADAVGVVPSHGSLTLLKYEDGRKKDFFPKRIRVMFPNSLLRGAQLPRKYFAAN